MYKRILRRIKLIFLIVIAVLGCSNDNLNRSDISKSITSEQISDGIITSRIINQDKRYSVEDFKITGLKNPNKLRADAIDKKGNLIVPEAKEIWHGFFNKKDIELRFYKTYQDAFEYGIPPAEKTISAPVRGVGKTTYTSQYGAYIVTGNLIILCELQIEVCDELIAKIMERKE